MDILHNVIPENYPQRIVHFARHERLTRHPFIVQTVGCIRKTQEIRYSFSTQNFSFILNGDGFYEYRGTRYEVHAPCCFLQSPGEPVCYAPHKSWRELYVVYSADCVAALVERGFILQNRFLWQVPASIGMRAALQNLLSLLDTSDSSVVADRIDMACEMLILESLFPPKPIEMCREESIVREFENQMRKNLLAELDAGEFARANGLQLATFRRHWNKHFPEPPARFRMRVRIDEACRMLVETRRHISEIAYAVGFKDPQYFSRKFYAVLGCTPTDYREHYRGKRT